MAAFNHIMLSDAVDNNRFSAEFFDPQYVFKPSNSFSWVPIGRILKKCEYGISISMNWIIVLLYDLKNLQQFQIIFLSNID
jgi:type I restriction enzyme, S subunit